MTGVVVDQLQFVGPHSDVVEHFESLQHKVGTLYWRLTEPFHILDASCFRMEIVLYRLYEPPQVYNIQLPSYARLFGYLLYSLSLDLNVFEYVY